MVPQAAAALDFHWVHGIPVIVALMVGGWEQWAKRCRQYRRPQQDRELVRLLARWFGALPWGPVGGATTIAAAIAATGSVLGGVRLVAIVCAITLAFVHVAVRHLFWAEWVAPLWVALSGIEDLKLEPDYRRPGRYLRIPRDWQWHTRRHITLFSRRIPLPSRHGDGINLGFPLDLRHYGTTKEHIEAQVEAVLGLRDVDYHWTDTGRASHLKILPAQVVPTKAKFSTPDICQVIETALTELPTAPVIALGKGDQPIAIDMDTEAPHFLVSAGTIGGKSVTIRNIVAQMLWADDQAIAVIVDKKEQSQRGLAEVPGVAVARSDEEINAALVAVWEEVQRRNRICRDIPLGAELPKFPRIVLGCEEMNVTTKTLNAWWRRTQGNRVGQAPGIYALDNILCMGRQVRTNVVLVGQQVNAKTTGGGEGRVNIAVRVLAEYGEAEWKMLAHGAEYVPAVSHKVQPGWCVVVHGREVEEGQRILMTDEQAHAWLTGRTNGERADVLEATFAELTKPRGDDTPETGNGEGGRSNPTPDAGGVGALGHRRGSVLAAQGAHGPSPSGPVFHEQRGMTMQGDEYGSGGNGSGDDGDVYATLRGMFEDGTLAGLSPSLPALRKAAQSPGFPPPVPMPGGFEYSRRAVVRFLTKRSERRARPTSGWVYALVAGGLPFLERLERTGNQDGQVKIGYTTRDPRTRAKEIAPYRPEDIVKLIEVDHPPDGDRLPDRDWHERFGDRELLVHPYDKTSEMRWIRGPVAEWLGMRVEVRR